MKKRPSSSTLQSRNISPPQSERRTGKLREKLKTSKSQRSLFHNLEKKPSTRDRGTLFDFFDSGLNKEIYHPGLKHGHEPNRVPERPKVVAKLRHGQLRVDEKLLRQECNRALPDRWFFYNTNKALPEKVGRTVTLFDESDYTMQQFRRPKPTIEERMSCFDLSSRPIDIRKPRPWSAPGYMAAQKLRLESVSIRRDNRGESP